MSKSLSFSGILPLLSVLIVAVVLMASVILAVLQVRTSVRVSAIQGCYSVAKGYSQTSGKGDTSDWTVQESRVNQDLLTDCINRVGF